MDYVSIEEAKNQRGLRLVLTALPGPPWGEATKAIFHVKKIPYVPVAQQPQVTNEALREWTGHDNAPIAIFDDEKPRTGWAEILLLAERLAPEPALIPADPEDRVRFFGLAHEICGEDGLGWNRRLLMIEDALRSPNEMVSGTVGTYLGARYGYSEAAAARAQGRILEILGALDRQLRSQREGGRAFLVGDALSALDLYWAAFASLIDPLPERDCPMPSWLRAAYVARDPEIRTVVEPELLSHRDRIWREHLTLPLDG